MLKKNGPKVTEDDLAASWIARVADGDSDSLTALYRLYHRPLLTIFNGILRDREAAEEVLQDTFVKAFHKASSFDSDKGAPFAWLVTIGRRLAIDRIRRNRVRPESELLEQPERVADKLSSEGRGSIVDKAEFAWLNEAMDILSVEQRKVILMAFIDGYTHHEIAELTGFPLGSVKSHIYRGLNTLRENYIGNND